MSHPRQTILASRPAALVLALSLVAGLSVPFLVLPPVRAAAVPPAGTVELSPTPPNDTQAVSPNIVVTFDDSGSMASAFMGDNRPFDNGGWGWNPWRCAGVIDPAAASGIGTHAMNGVYYNPNVTYSPPVKADGTAFPDADATLKAVWNDGVSKNRPYNPTGGNGTVDFTNQVDGSGNPTYWQCYSDNSYSGDLGSVGNHHTTTERVTGGGPYYYQYTGPAIAVDAYGNPTSGGRSDLYTKANWTAVAVPAAQWQNWANWWAYYRTRNQMARTSVSRAFGKLGSPAADGHSFGNAFRVAWQNLYTSDTFRLQADTIITALMDSNSPAACDATATDPTISLVAGSTTTAPDCYRTAFFNWIFNVDATGNTPTRAATIRAGEFFQRGYGNTGGTGDLHDPYWEPPHALGADGKELVCRQNFQMLVTDGYSNEGNPSIPSNNGSLGSPFRNVTVGFSLPDGTVYSSSAPESRLYWDQRGGDDKSSMANIAFNYWATDLRPDLYSAALAGGITNPVSPYMPDGTTGVVTGATSPALEKYFNPNNDPANWPHVVQYMVTLGVPGTLNHSDDYDCKAGTNDACSLRTGATTSDGSKGWPQRTNNSPQSIDDIWHATAASRGKYFNAGNPQELVDQLGSILTNIAARAAAPTTGAVNASVAASGALSFNTGYDTKDWFGTLLAVTLNPDGTVGGTIWDAGALLDARASTSRQILSATRDAAGAIGGVAFEPTTTFDASELLGLQTPALAGGNDTLANRIKYLRGDRTYEADGTFRTRTHVLGAIINSQPLYVSYAGSGYRDTWPAGSPEAAVGAQTYDAFVGLELDRPGTLYIGANDGMLHAFDAALKCNATDPLTGECTSYGPDQEVGAGKERWAFIPRAVYANLGNLTDASAFKYAPTVDGTPVTRDVFFADKKWHTILAGGLGIGGRGVYALDITDPVAVTEASASSKVLWEFDADATAPATCKTNFGSCRPSDLGYTFGTPNIGRLANGKWVVIVSNGYFPDCTKPSTPTNDTVKCQAISAEAPKDSSGNPYSALFVLDAETGELIAELKTPTGVTGVTSFGLASPVLGDYDNDQLDDVAFAGDLEGNLWRFDLTDASPVNWKVTLAYQGIDDAGVQGVQPITVMPRLFPDPVTNRFIVVFGTGKFLGAGDNTSSSAAIQSVYGIRDSGGCATVDGCKVTHADLVQQTLTESLAPATLPDGSPNPNAGATLRTLTDNAAPATAGGWYFDLYTTQSGGKFDDAGERVVVAAGAIFSSNTAVISTLIPGTSDPCNPSAKGAVMAINATNGGPGAGVASLGGSPIVGGRVNNVRTSGGLPLVSALGGGQVFIPGVSLSGTAGKTPLGLPAPIWRRRSWQEIHLD